MKRHQATIVGGASCGGFNRSGFTLVEILIVVIILAILAAIVLPLFSDYTEDAELQTVVYNWKYAAKALRVYKIQNGGYPPDKNPAQYPAGLESMLEGMEWTSETPIGGQWDWDQGVFGVTAAISIYRPTWDAEKMAKVDAALDDGNLSTGCFRSRTSGYMYIIEE